MNRRKFVRLSALAGLSGLAACQKKSSASADPNVDYYTCTMHPSVRSHDAKAKCPICSMDLVPVLKKGAVAAEANPAEPVLNEFRVPVERQQQIGVTYATVERRPLQRTIRTVGIVAPDTTRRWTAVARGEGYVQKLSVTSPGELVEKGQPLLTMEADKTKKAAETPTIISPLKGVVEEVLVAPGRKVAAGDPLVTVTDLSQVWVWGEFYDEDLSFLSRGQKVSLTTKSSPGQQFEGTIGLIDPFLAETSRTAKVRIDLPNAELKLRPGMYADVEVHAEMGEGLTIPVSAVLPTGSHALAFVGKGEGKLEPRFVQLGRKCGDLYEVLGGLQEGESVVASANFLIDAESKVQGAVKSFEEPAITPAKL